MPNVNKNAKPKNNEFKKNIISVLIGALIGTIIFYLITALLTTIVYKNDIDPETYSLLMLIPGAISGFLSGYISVMPIKRHGLLLGILSTLPMFFIIIAVSSFIAKSSVDITGWTVFGAMAACGGAAGILAANNKKKKKTHSSKKSRRA